MVMFLDVEWQTISNYQLIKRILKILKMAKEEVKLIAIKEFTPLNLQFGKCSMVKCGDRFSLFVDKNKTKIYACGYNKNGECGVLDDDLEIFELPHLIYDLRKDIGATEEEIIEDLTIGYSHFILKTSQRLLFFGNNVNNQLPIELSNHWSTNFLKGQVINLDKFGQNINTILKVESKYDRTAILFKNGTCLLFGGKFNTTELNPFIDFTKELPGLNITKIGLGVNYEIIHGYYN